MIQTTVTKLASIFHSFPIGDTTNRDPREPLRRLRSSELRDRGNALRLSQSALNPMRVRCQLGERREHEGIAMYQKSRPGPVSLTIPTVVSICNIELERGILITVHGRPDAIDVQNCVVVEIKARAHRLLNYVPMHERVQCMLYMKMFNLKNAHLVEIFGTQMRVHDLVFDSVEWVKAVDRVRAHIVKSDSRTEH